MGLELVRSIGPDIFMIMAALVLAQSAFSFMISDSDSTDSRIKFCPYIGI